MSRFLVVFLLFFVLFGCKKKDEIIINEPVVKPNYFPMKTGNYWVYDCYKVDSMGVETLQNNFDSTVVVGDTIVGSHTYHKMISYKFGSNLGLPQFLRDSSSYIVDSHGRISFSYSDTTSILAKRVEIINGDTLFTNELKMLGGSYQVNVPAGSFLSLASAQNIIEYMKVNGTINKINIQHKTFYSKDIGIIQYSYNYFSQPYVRFEMRLRDYKVN